MVVYFGFNIWFRYFGLLNFDCLLVACFWFLFELLCVLLMVLLFCLVGYVFELFVNLWCFGLRLGRFVVTLLLLFVCVWIDYVCFWCVFSLRLLVLAFVWVVGVLFSWFGVWVSLFWFVWLFFVVFGLLCSFLFVWFAYLVVSLFLFGGFVLFELFWMILFSWLCSF